MGLTHGSISEGKVMRFSASVGCDGCPARAARHEAPTPGRAERLAVRAAEEAGFTAHNRGRRWLCPACRLRSLPPQLLRLFPRLAAEYGVELPGEDADATKAKGGTPRGMRRRAKPAPGTGQA
jgi:hypothetical protein